MPSYIEDVAAFTEAFGPQHAAIILPLATVSWPSETERDEFIAGMVGGQ